MSKFAERKEFGVNQIHLAANLLNPVVQGNKLSPTELIDVISFICEVGQNMGFNMKEVNENVADYRDKEGFWRCPFIWNAMSENEFSPLVWCRSLPGTCMLVDVTVRILGHLSHQLPQKQHLTHFHGYTAKRETDCQCQHNVQQS